MLNRVRFVHRALFCVAALFCAAIVVSDFYADDDLNSVASPGADEELVDGGDAERGGAEREWAFRDLVEDGFEGNGLQASAEAQADDGGITYEELIKLPPIEEKYGWQTRETICGTDDRVRVSGTTRYPWAANCRLVLYFSDGAYVCTGWMIGRGTVMAAGHCVHSGGAGGEWASKIIVIPGMNGRSRPFGTFTSRNFRSVTGWTQYGKATHDMGCILLKKGQQPGRRTGYFGFASYSTSRLNGMNVNTAGYPADKDISLFNAGQYRAYGSITRVDPQQIFYLIDTFGGQSGSCVWRYTGRSRYAVAIHAYGGCPNGATRITSGRFKLLRKWKNLRQ